MYFFSVFIGGVVFFYNACSDTGFAPRGSKGAVVIINSNEDGDLVGAEFTHSRNVKLTLMILFDYDQTCFGNESECRSGVWDSFDPENNMVQGRTLEGNGILQTHVCFRHSELEAEESKLQDICVTDDIILDEISPQVIIDLTESVGSVINHGEIATVVFTAEDHPPAGSDIKVSGVKETLCALEKRGAGEVVFHDSDFVPCESPQEYDQLNLGEYVFGVKAIDGVGNESEISFHNWQVVNPYEGSIQHVLNLTVDDRFLRNLDIVFVIDGSGSMKDEKKRLADQLNGFLNVVDGFDYRVAIIPTDANGKSGRPILLSGQRYFDANLRLDG